MKKSKVTKVMQKYVDAIAICTEKEIRLAKRFRDAVQVFENAEQKKVEKRGLLKESTKIRETIEATIANLRTVKSNQEIEMIRLRQQLKSLTKRYAAQEVYLNSERFTIHEMDREIAYKKRIILNVLKIATDIYEDEANPADFVRGFIIKKLENIVIPYEIDKSKCSASESTDQMWELVRQTSPYTEKWEDILSE